MCSPQIRLLVGSFLLLSFLSAGQVAAAPRDGDRPMRDFPFIRKVVKIVRTLVAGTNGDTISVPKP